MTSPTDSGIVIPPDWLQYGRTYAEAGEQAADELKPLEPPPIVETD
jgi:hypothetical protein